MSIYDFTVKDQHNNDVPLGEYQGQVLLIVNTATECGLTPQYEGLQAIYEKYHDKGFEILDFPCNQFMGQAPGTVEEINEFCSLNYSTTFPRFAKIDVNGNGASPLYAWLREQAPEDEENTESLEFEEVIKPLKPLEKQADIKWNFGKFLIDREGNIAHRFSPGYTPEHVAPFIEELL